MVGPVADEKRQASARALGAGFVGFVGLSAGLTAFYGGASLGEMVLLVVAGVLVGAGALFVLTR